MYIPVKIKLPIATSVYEGTTVFSAIENAVRDDFSKTHKLFILVDENTKEHCLQALTSFAPSLSSATVIEIKSGEANKSIETANYIWSKLSEHKAGRDSLLVNLGGGVITDLGGFVASTYHRGIPYLNVPTTLLGMTDASIGGKLAVNLNGIKNQVGTFELPVSVYIYSGFLRTIKQEDFLNGIAEIMKYGLIMDYGLWRRVAKLDIRSIFSQPFLNSLWDEMIKKSIKVKCELVEKDFRDVKERRMLNFGHTVGHAFESLFLERDGKEISHGHAVAAGIICESYLSIKKAGLKETEFESIVKVSRSLFPILPIEKSDFPKLIAFMQHDKKNINRQINFSLIKAIGKGLINQQCWEDQIIAALDFYCSLK